MQKSSTDGLRSGEFLHLSKKEKNKLLVVMARIMERAYRRGVQQALHLNNKQAILPVILSDLAGYRYNTSIDTSYGLDGFRTTSIARLFMEEDLELIGFEEPEKTKGP